MPISRSRKQLAPRTARHGSAGGSASMDLFGPTISFSLSHGFPILQHSRRERLWLGVTTLPSAEWIAHQRSEAYGWQQAPRYIIRDRDCIYGKIFTHRLRAMGIRDRPIAPRSPWQNGYAERLIGSIRRPASTMLLCSATGIFVTCSDRIRNITTSSRALVAAQGRNDPALHSHTSDPSSGRTTAPIYPSVSSD